MRKKSKTRPHAKIIQEDSLEKIVKKLRKQGLRVVTTNGCFDIIHVGHTRSFEYAKSLGDILIVGINSDASVRASKGQGRPIVPGVERAEIIANISSVDYVFIFNTKTPEPWLSKVKPDIHVKGSDYSLQEVVERGVVEKGGGKIVLFTHTGKHSTSRILKKIPMMRSKNPKLHNL